MIDEELIRKVASLSMIRIREEEIEQYKKEFEEILRIFDKIREVDVEGVEPSFTPYEVEGNLREDNPEPTLTEEEVFENIKNKKERFFIGPKTIE